MLTFALIAATTFACPAQANTDRLVHYEFVVSAPLRDAWNAWTTSEGLRTFFGPGARIELETFGRFDIHFDPDAPKGRKGAEGNVVLAIEPERMLTTTWDAPPEFPNVRAQRTFLEIRFTPEDEKHTCVTITQSGFGRGEEWERVHRYFTGAWTWVAAAMQYRFDVGPINWQSPPDLRSRMQAIGGDAAVQWLSNK